MWDKIKKEGDKALTLFMAVPTIYTRLISYYAEQDRSVQEELTRAAERLRLMVSGSAALPIPVMEKFKECSGHSLLERYGMTEIGMCLSNPLHGTRLPGHVGSPLPGVEVKIGDDDELLVKGTYLEYVRVCSPCAKVIDVQLSQALRARGWRARNPPGGDVKEEPSSAGATLLPAAPPAPADEKPPAGSDDLGDLGATMI